MDDSVAIKVENVYKEFLLPHEKTSSLKSTVTSLLRGRKTQGVERQKALQDISFEVKEGEFFGIVGRNGSGKSTLLKIIAQIYQPTKGTVDVRGRLVPFIELGVGFNAELTGRENVYLSASLMGFSKKEIDAMYDDIVDFAELKKFMDQKLKNYSSGMIVRLAFSIATRAHGDILLIDEVLAVGDAEFQRKCFNHFHKLKKQGKTVVFVSHDMGAIREHCDRAILIEKSKIVKSGNVHEVASAYTRMFSKEGGSSEDAKGNKKRYGNKKLVISNLTFSPTQISGFKPINFSFDVTAKEDLDDPILGFSVRNMGGTGIMGTNTQVKQRPVGTIKKGQKITCHWEIPNLFNNGTYILDISAIEADSTPCDWWEDAVEFEVFKEELTYFATLPEIGVRLEEYAKKNR